MRYPITLKSGREIDLADPDPAALTPDVIAWGLAGVLRWGAQSPVTWSVADHSLFLARHCPASLVKRALLHDAAEGLGLGDLVSPIKHSHSFAAYRELERRLLVALEFRYGVDLSSRSGRFGLIHSRASECERIFLFQLSDRCYPADRTRQLIAHEYHTALLATLPRRAPSKYDTPPCVP